MNTENTTELEQDSSPADGKSALTDGLGIASSFPIKWVMRSEKQISLEINGCVFNGQELLDNHEIDLNKPCRCGRLNATPNDVIQGSRSDPAGM